MSKTFNRSGRCACGAVTFTADCSRIVLTAHCHCLDCQKATGSAFATFVAIPADSLHVSGAEQLRSWTVTGQSGRVTREFCATCGSPMFSRTTSAEGLRFIKAGAFDEAGWIEPVLACWTMREQPWARLPAGLPGMPHNP